MGEVLRVIRDAPGGVAYHLHFAEQLPGQVWVAETPAETSRRLDPGEKRWSTMPAYSELKLCLGAVPARAGAERRRTRQLDKITRRHNSWKRRGPAAKRRRAGGNADCTRGWIRSPRATPAPKN